MDSVKTTQKEKQKGRSVKIIAVICALAAVLGAASLALSLFVSKDRSLAGEFDQIYIDGTQVIEYHGAQYSVDEKGNVWEEKTDTIRLVAKNAGAKLLAVYDDDIYLLTQKDGRSSVSKLSHTNGNLSSRVDLGSSDVSSFSMTDAGIYYMAASKIFLASDKSLSEILDLSSLVYVCDDGHEHDCGDTASPANAKFFTVYDDTSILLYSENPNYVDESEEEGEILGENEQHIVFIYDFSSESLERYYDNVDFGISTLASSEKITLNGVSIPFAKYPPSSSYFTKNGKACTCHNLNRCLNNASPCNCVRFLSSIGESYFDLAATQCFGFARYCQYKIFGYCDKPSDSSKFTNGLGGSWEKGSFTASALQDMFLQYGAGGHIRTGGHSLFVISVNATGFTTYECNTSSKDCKVYTRNWTWSTFYDYTKYKSIDYYKIPTSFINAVDTTYPTGDYLISADGGLRLRQQPTTDSSILVTIPNETMVTITETVKIDGATSNAWWGKTTYNGKTGWISLDYAKFSSEIKSIQIVTMPNRVVFNEGEKFSSEGLQIQLNYVNGTSSDPISPMSVTTPNMSKAGTYDVKVSYNGFSTTYQVTVKSIAVLPTDIVFDRPTITVMTGGEFTPAYGIDYTVLPDSAHDKTVEWSVIVGKHLVSVDKTTGVVTAVNSSSSFVEGIATIRATSVAKPSIYKEYRVEVIEASSNGEWSQPASNIPDGVSLSDYVIQYCATESDYNKGNWKNYDENTTVKAYKYRFKNEYKITWYYALDNSDGNVTLPSSFGYPSSVKIGERVYISRLKAVTQTNRIFAGWFTTAEGARTLDMAYAYKNTDINSDTEFFAGWIDLSSEELLVTTSDEDPIHTAGKTLPSFGLFASDINISDTDGGLRFYGHISKALQNKLKTINSNGIQYGMVVQLANKAGEELRSSTGAGYVQDGHSIVVNANLNYGEYQFMSGNSYTVFTTLVTNIPLESAKTEIAARAFLVYYDANGIRRAFYFTNTAENTEDLSLKAMGAKTSMYERAQLIFDSASKEEKDWMKDNVLGYTYKEKDE